MTIGFDLGHDLDLECSRSNIELAISMPKWSDCHDTKSKRTDWTLGLKCDHQIWPWPCSWPWNFKAKYKICYILTKSGQIATKRKANMSIRTWGLKCAQWAWPWPRPWYLNFQGHMWSWPFGDQVRCKDLPIVTGVTSDVGVPSTHLVMKR